MKKVLFSLLSASALLCSTSCADEAIAPAGEGEAMVNFTVQLNDGNASRAISDGLKATQLFYEVYAYDKDGAKPTAIDKVTTMVKKNGKLTAEVGFPLVKGQKYDIVFWAQKEGAYNAQDLQNITVFEEDVTLANDDTRDAFTAVFSIEKVQGAQSHVVELTRPFAQVNFGAPWADVEAAEAAGANIQGATSQIKVKGIATQYNALTKAATGNQDVYTTFNWNTVPANETLLTKDNVTYNYLATAYVLVPGDDKQSLADLEMTITTGLNQDITVKVPAAPVQRNYRTNVLGNLLTNQTDFTVEIDADFDGDLPSAEDEIGSLFVMAATGGKFTLSNDLELEQTLTVQPGVSLEIDLNGKTISGSIHKSVGAIIKNNGNLTIKGGTVSSLAKNGGSAIANYGTMLVEDATLNGAEREGNSWPAYPVNNYGNITLKNCAVNGYQGAIACNAAGTTIVENCTVTKNYMKTSSHVFYINHADANVIVNGGTYAHNGFDGSLAYVNAGTITVNDGTFTSKDGGYGMAALTNGSIIVNGGNFESAFLGWGGKITLNGGTFTSEPNDTYLAEGYAATKNSDGKWVVRKSMNNEELLAQAIKNSANGETIVLTDDITLSETLMIPAGKEFTLDLGGKTLSHTDVANKYALNNHGTLTIKNGTVNARGIYNGYSTDGNYVSTAKLIVENGTYNAKGTNGGAAIYNYGIVEIKAGEFTSIGGYSLNNQTGAKMTIGKTSRSASSSIKANNGIYCSGATLVINDGEIKGNRSGCHVVYSWNSNVTINGGTIHNNNSGNSTLMAAGTSVMTVNGGTYSINDGRANPGWTSCLTDTQNSAKLIVNNGTFNGGFRVQAGTTMTIMGGSFNDCYGSNYNIYGTAIVKGGTYTDATALNFAKNYVAEGYEVNGNGTVVAK